MKYVYHFCVKYVNGSEKIFNEQYSYYDGLYYSDKPIDNDNSYHDDFKNFIDEQIVGCLTIDIISLSFLHIVDDT